MDGRLARILGAALALATASGASDQGIMTISRMVGDTGTTTA
jgi:hypothetical protein